MLQYYFVILYVTQATMLKYYLIFLCYLGSSCFYCISLSRYLYSTFRIVQCLYTIYKFKVKLNEAIISRYFFSFNVMLYFLPSPDILFQQLLLFSKQLLHQNTVFSACSFFTLDFALINAVSTEHNIL